MLIVPDCVNDPGFQFFHPQQANYLRSLVAYPLAEFSPDGRKPVRAALLLDTDVAGYFREEDCGWCPYSIACGQGSSYTNPSGQASPRLPIGE
jgi:hypothetical protein